MWARADGLPRAPPHAPSGSCSSANFSIRSSSSSRFRSSARWTSTWEARVVSQSATDTPPHPLEARPHRKLPPPPLTLPTSRQSARTRAPELHLPVHCAGKSGPSVDLAAIGTGWPQQIGAAQKVDATPAVRLGDGACWCPVRGLPHYSSWRRFAPRDRPVHSLQLQRKLVQHLSKAQSACRRA